MSIPQIVSGIAWTIVYAFLVYRSFKDKSYAMPIAALALNFTWEVTFSFIYPPSPLGSGDAMGIVSTVINAVWCLFDIGLVVAFFKNGYPYFKESYGLPKWLFYCAGLAAFGLGFFIMISGGHFAASISDYFGNSAFEGAKLIADVQNAIMSVLFVSFFYTRKKAGHPIEGQSFYAAVAKLLGTFVPGIEYCVIHADQPFPLALVIVCFLFDLWYCILIFKELRAQKINPLARI